MQDSSSSFLPKAMWAVSCSQRPGCKLSVRWLCRICEAPAGGCIKGSEPHMPISLVSIAAANSTVTVASHNGCLRHYKYRPPNDAAISNGFAEGTELRSSPIHSMATSSSHDGFAEQGSHISHAEAEEREHQSESGHSGHSREGLRSSKDEVPAESFRALDVAGFQGEVCNGHMQRTDHDREEQPSQISGTAEHSDSRKSNSGDNPRGATCEQGINSTALGNLNVEAVSALTVIESQLLYSPEGSQPDHLLSGFQVSILTMLVERNDSIVKTLPLWGLSCDAVVCATIP